MKKPGRPKIRYFIFDCPSDHEIEGTLVTESEAIRAVLANKHGRPTLVCARRFTTSDSFKAAKGTYGGVRLVHLGCHGSPDGLDLIKGKVKWKRVAERLCALFPALKPSEERVLALSCCHSADGARALKRHLRGHFSGICHFVEEEIGFSEAMTAWSMFYLKVKHKKPLGSVLDPINRFMGRTTLKDVVVA